MNAEPVATFRHANQRKETSCAAVEMFDVVAALESVGRPHAAVGRASARFASAIDSKCSVETPTCRGPTLTVVGNASPADLTAVVYGPIGSCLKQLNTETTVS